MDEVHPPAASGMTSWKTVVQGQNFRHKLIVIVQCYLRRSTCDHVVYESRVIDLHHYKIVMCHWKICTSIVEVDLYLFFWFGDAR